ncbi:OmpA family protein [Undibacterium sp. TC4M20W]|uniref:OmpA family protein n=1 Tax=Undibacterium sp. TC4M20W TaxID=3413052 RepID=UPI003BEFD1BA
MYIMHKALKSSLLILSLLLFLLLSTSISPLAFAATDPAHEKVFTTDAPNAKDHPLTGRYQGSSIMLQTRKAFDEISFPVGPATEPDYSSNKKFSKLLKAEGTVTRTVYMVPKGRSSLEVFRNFTDNLASKGFKPVFQCDSDSCGPSFKSLKYNWNDVRTHVQGEGYDVTRNRFVQAVFDGAKDIRYALLQKGAGAATTYVGVYAALNSGGTMGDLTDSMSDRVSVLVEVLEPKAMEQNIVTVDADAISKELAANGAVSFYGLYFDTDKAIIKPESKPQLDQMAKYLKANTAAVYIVGHTDTQGVLDYNMTLSGKRAQAVVDALKGYGIADARLIAKGVGPLAPRASNAADAGRAKNRRVEMVLR